MVQFYSSACGEIMFSTSFIGEIVPSLLYVLASLMMISWLLSVWVYFWTLCFALFFCMYILIPLPCCFNYYSFAVYFSVSAISASGSDSCSDSSHYVFCFMACLVILCWKPYMIWLEIRLCLLFAIAMMSEANIPPSVLGFVFCVFFQYHYRCLK